MSRHLAGVAALVLATCLQAATCLPAAAATVPPAAIPYSRMDLPWWRARFEAKQIELHSRPIDLLWLGDSITQDWETDGPESWRRFKPAWDRFYGGRNAINLGFKGDATGHLLWRLQHGELEGIHPRAAIILIGANNFGHLHWPAAPTEIGIQAVIDTVHRRLPDTRILLLGVLPSIRNPWVDQNTATLNAALARRYAHDPVVTFQNVGSLFMQDGHVDRTRFLDIHLTPPDPPLHPNAETQQRLADAIEPTVSRMLDNPGKPSTNPPPRMPARTH